MRMFVALAVLLLGFCAGASDVAPRHSTGGTVGPNGVKERVAFKLNKIKANKDVLSIMIDLGDHKFASAKDETFNNRIITVTLGTQIITFQTSEEAEVKADGVKLKLVQNGAGLKIDVKNGAYTNLLSELMGRTGEVDMMLMITDNHLPVTTSANEAEPRHAHTIYSKLLGLEVKEGKATLTGRG